ncbi:MAG TPA: lipoprotein signal peptidase [Prevotella sp.]|nr:lipoprotein signal peptidase [Prevotella sp.]
MKIIMNNFFRNHRKVLVIFIVVLALIIDQVIKIAVKTTMTLGESVRITDWFYIDFIENNGMAWGMTFFNKMVLSLFRIAAIALIGYYLYLQIKRKARTRYIVCLSFILAGAIGNMLDSMFYGLIFNASSPFYVSYLVPFGHGYSSFLLGKVVDMFYFPLLVTTWPDWIPFVGGQQFIFFSPVFNFADSCVTVGIISLLLFCRKDLNGFCKLVEDKKQDPKIRKERK